MKLCKNGNKKLKIHYKTLNFEVLFIVETPQKKVNNKVDIKLKTDRLYTIGQNVYYILYIIIKEKANKKNENKNFKVKKSSYPQSYQQCG